MKAFEIISPGLLSSVQDLGRTGYGYFAIPSSGALDKFALIRANNILGNQDNTPAIEFNFLPAGIRFLGGCTICLTGANMHFRINASIVPMNEEVYVNKGDELKGKWAVRNARSYLAIKGLIDYPKIYGSHASLCNNSTNSILGRSLKKGDIVNWNVHDSSAKANTEQNLEFSDWKIKISKGPEWDNLNDELKAILTSQNFSISTQSNRMGARLREKLQSTSYKALKNSVPVLPGFIQWTPGGDLIVLLQDGQTTGGYPRIAYIQEKELSRFNQIGAQEKISFSL